MSPAAPAPVDDTAVHEWLDQRPAEDVHGVCPTCSPLDQPTAVALCGIEMPSNRSVDRDINCAACIVRFAMHGHGIWRWL